MLSTSLTNYMQGTTGYGTINSILSTSSSQPPSVGPSSSNVKRPVRRNQPDVSFRRTSINSSVGAWIGIPENNTSPSNLMLKVWDSLSLTTLIQRRISAPEGM